MAYGIITFHAAGAAREPSPSLWSNCPGVSLTDSGKGTFFHEEFLGGVADTIASGEQRPAYGPFNVDCDDDTVTVFLSDVGGKLDVETDGDDNDAAALFTRPFARTGLNTGRKWWFEALIQVGAVADQAVFVGLAENDALSRDVISDDCAALVGQSYVGFRILNTDTDAWDAAYKLDAGTEVEMSTLVTSSTAITNDATNDRTAAAVTADAAFKLGMRFDGKDKLEVFASGTKVASVTLSSTTFPNDVDMGMIIAIKTGTAAAQSMAIDWARCAYQERG